MTPQGQTVQMVPLDRRIAVDQVHDEDRTVTLVFSTKAGGDVLRHDWETGKKFWERLSLDPAHVRLDRLNHGAPLLNAHSAWELGNVIGVVEENSVALTKSDAKATVRFSKRADVEPFYQDVRDGIIRNVSVGYRVHRMEEQAAAKDGYPVRLAIDWEPFEISMVPMGADAGARVRRLSSEVETYACALVASSARQAGQDDADRARRLRLASVRG